MAITIIAVTAIKEKQTKWSLLLTQVVSASQHRAVLITFLSLAASTEQKDLDGLGLTRKLPEASMAGSGLKVFWGMFLGLALLVQNFLDSSTQSLSKCHQGSS